jgi:hypothetical protein
MAIRLTQGVDPADAIRALDESAGDLENRRTWANDAAGSRKLYLRWADIGHRILRQYLGSATRRIREGPPNCWYCFLCSFDVRRSHSSPYGWVEVA